jgi:hypothetical protein
LPNSAAAGFEKGPAGSEKIGDGFSRSFAMSGDLKVAVLSLLDPTDCFGLKLHFRRAKLDSPADLKPVFPYARLNHLNLIFL